MNTSKSKWAFERIDGGGEYSNIFSIILFDSNVRVQTNETPMDICHFDLLSLWPGSRVKILLSHVSIIINNDQSSPNQWYLSCFGVPTGQAGCQLRNFVLGTITRQSKSPLILSNIFKTQKQILLGFQCAAWENIEIDGQIIGKRNLDHQVPTISMLKASFAPN